MVENLKTLCQYLTIEISNSNKNLLKDPDLEQNCVRLMKLSEIPNDINFVHINQGHANWYPVRMCEEFHCFQCLVIRIMDKKTVCEHGKNFTEFELVHVLYLDKILKGK